MSWLGSNKTFNNKLVVLILLDTERGLGAVVQYLRFITATSFGNCSIDQSSLMFYCLSISGIDLLGVMYSYLWRIRRHQRLELIIRTDPVASLIETNIVKSKSSKYTILF